MARHRIAPCANTCHFKIRRAGQHLCCHVGSPCGCCGRFCRWSSRAANAAAAASTVLAAASARLHVHKPLTWQRKPLQNSLGMSKTWLTISHFGLGGGLQVPWRQAWANALFWLVVLGGKAAFDYFAIIKPLRRPMEVTSLFLQKCPL